jgi:hypothetical protein
VNIVPAFTRDSIALLRIANDPAANFPCCWSPGLKTCNSDAPYEETFGLAAKPSWWLPEKLFLEDKISSANELIERLE